MQKLNHKFDAMMNLIQTQNNDIALIKQTLNIKGGLHDKEKRQTTGMNQKMDNIIEEENENQSKESSNISVSDDSNSEKIIKLKTKSKISSKSLVPDI